MSGGMAKICLVSCVRSKCGRATKAKDLYISPLFRKARKYAERNADRKEKDFARADEIRDQLQADGIEIMDSPQGTTWRKA